MKKIVAFTILMCMVLTLAACGNVEITMQEIYDSNQTEALLKNHESVYVREEMDGEIYGEKYLTEEYVYDYVPGEEGEDNDWVEFTTDEAGYMYVSGEFVRYLSITPDGINDVSASSRAERYASAVLGEDTIDETIESVSKKDGRITVKSFFGQEKLEDMAEGGLASVKYEYALDAKNREVISLIGDATYEDGTAFRVATEVAYDAEAPEMVNTFLDYVNRTEDLRNITVVNNPGTEKEASESIQVPKGLIIGFRFDEGDAYQFELYTDAACTEFFDPYADTDSDQTIYVKWAE